jgi:hypothetical protein
MEIVKQGVVGGKKGRGRKGLWRAKTSPSCFDHEHKRIGIKF